MLSPFKEWPFRAVVVPETKERVVRLHPIRVADAPAHIANYRGITRRAFKIRARWAR
jgi:hypothetical protein